LEAVGGMDKIKSTNSILLKYDAEVMGMAISSEEKRIDGKLAQNISMNGNPMQAVVTTQEAVYSKQGASKNPLPENMSNDMKPMAGLFLELNLLNSDKVLLGGIEAVNGKDAYRVEVPGEVISLTLFYDVETGLKVKEIQNVTMNGNTQSQPADLLEYKEFEGLKFPTIREGVMQGQQITFKLTEVKINEGVTEADFD
ncbi:MAG: insulinase family protein, partial [Bacteroidota bacterium]